MVKTDYVHTLVLPSKWRPVGKREGYTTYFLLIRGSSVRIRRGLPELVNSQHLVPDMGTKKLRAALFGALFAF